MLRFQHLPNRAALHYTANFHRFGIGLSRVHATTHVRIEREVNGAAQDLPRSRRLGLRFNQLEVARFGFPYRTRGQQDLTVCVGHEVPSEMTESDFMQEPILG